MREVSLTQSRPLPVSFVVQRLARLAQSYDSCVISAELAHFTLMLNLKNEGRTFLFQLHSEFSLSANQISVRVFGFPGGKTIRQCIRYTDCDNSRLSQMFPAISAFTYRCCSSNLCNSGTASTAVTPLVALLGSLLSVWWCWM